MPTPILSLSLSQLNLGKKTSSQSANSVLNASFFDKDGGIKHGYYKRCNHNNYPPLLAKYTVAFSVFVRAALGKKASEDRLVYGYELVSMSETERLIGNLYLKETKDGLEYEILGLDEKLKKHTIPWDKLPADIPKTSAEIMHAHEKWLPTILEHTNKIGHTNNKNSKIVGTLSLEVPDFVPLLSITDQDYTDPKMQSLGNPDKEMLIKKNVAELLVSAYRHKNNDLHPANFSVNGLIDWDELYYELTSIIKGKRLISGLPAKTDNTSDDLKEEELRTFPRIDTRVHWPSNYVPKNLNPFKTYKTGAFSQLEGDTQFTYQYLFAILKELVAFDKTVLAERLRLYLGEEYLNLDELPSEKKTLLLHFGQKNKLFYTEDKSERSFIEHCLIFFELEHQKFRNLVINMPEFRQFLMNLNKDSSELNELKQWFVRANTINLIPYKSESLELHLQEIWRDCFEGTFENHINEFNRAIHLSKASPFFSEEESKKSADKTLKDVENIVSLLVNATDKMTIDTEKNNMVRAIDFQTRKIIIDFRNELTSLKATYYKDSNLTIEKNHQWIEKVQAAIHAHKKRQGEYTEWLESIHKKLVKRKEIKPLLDCLTLDKDDLFREINEVFDSLDKTLVEFEMSEPQKEEKPVMLPRVFSLSPTRTREEKSSIKFPSPILKGAAKEDKSTTQQLADYLTEWLKPEKQSIIKDCINKAKLEHDPASYNYFTSMVYSWTRTERPKDIENESLSNIFSKGGWTSSSFNTIIIKNICITMLNDDTATTAMKELYKKIMLFDNRWWANCALDVAMQAGLKKSPSLIHS